jgi:phosphoribosylformimino-5-aminoimidazole carboxamide ribotide isomerase
MLGRGNEEAARSALAAYPGGMQIGGGITAANAPEWITAGASHVIVTSYLFDSAGRFLQARLEELVAAVGPERIVVDLSCKAGREGWIVAMNRWQTLTDLCVDHATLDCLSASCAEFLIHAVDVEGKCEGIDEPLVRHLGAWGGRPMTYAGGIRSIEDFRRIQDLSGGRLDATVGSALDLFGGSGVRYADCLAFR